MKKLIASALLAATVTGGAIAVAAAAPVAAAGARPAGRPAAEASAERGHHPRLRAAMRQAVKTSAEAIGITPKELVAELKAGRSIAEVAEAKGVPVSKVTDALVAKATARIDQAVADGKLTAERAEKAKARLPKLADRIVNRHKGDKPAAGN